MEPDQLKEYLDTSVKLAKLAGPAFKDGFYRTGQFANSSAFDAEDKQGNVSDCVTAVDKHIESLIFSKLRELYPTHAFVGEETTAETGNTFHVTDKPTWIVDPVDGTNNFVHHFPFTGISIALAVDRKPVVGVIYLPVLDELYTAAHGLGAFLNGEPLPQLPAHAITAPRSLEQCALLTEHGSDRSAKTIASRMRSFERLLTSTHDGGAGLQNLRVTGGAAPDLAFVAKGAAELYWECGPHAWDFAAGVVILTEAGGQVFDGTGWWGKGACALKDLNIWNRKIIAVRYIPDVDGVQGSGKEIQRRIASELLRFVEDIEYTPDGIQD